MNTMYCQIEPFSITFSVISNGAQFVVMSHTPIRFTRIRKCIAKKKFSSFFLPVFAWESEFNLCKSTLSTPFCFMIFYQLIKVLIIPHPKVKFFSLFSSKKKWFFVSCSRFTQRGSCSVWKDRRAHTQFLTVKSPALLEFQ